MEEKKELQVINTNGLIDLNKSDLKALGKNAIQSVKDGWIDPLTALIAVKKHQEVLSAMESELKPLANDRTVEKNYSEHGVDVGQSMLGVKYDFTATGDREWLELTAKMVKLKEQLTERETFLKSLTKELTQFDEETGELIKIQPPIKSGALGLVLKIK